MILSPYLNPPYKTPTPEGSTSPPPIAPSSPKRKRNDSTESIDTSLQLDTDIQSDSNHMSGMNSPRTKVATKLEALDIRQVKQPIVAIPDDGRHRFPRNRVKRIKRTPTRQEDQIPHVTETPDQSERQEPSNIATPVPEISETPDCRTERPASPPLSPKNLKATHNATDASTIPLSVDLPTPGSVSPLPKRSELTSDQASLTWQEDEITGHDIDITDANDDGEGINGIGFKPTPAIAYARQQRRKQQVNEWRAREAREARQRRMDRRRGGGDETTTRAIGFAVEGEGDGKRMVRFVGVG